MSGINRWSQCPSDEQIHEDPEGEYVLHSDHEAEMARLRAMAQEQGVKDGNEITRLRDEVEAYRKDAERYRWLQNADNYPNQIGGFWNCLGETSEPEEMDEAIDAAMGASA